MTGLEDKVLKDKALNIKLQKSILYQKNKLNKEFLDAQRIRAARYYIKNREKVLERQRIYDKINGDKKVIRNHVRRAKQKGSFGNYTSIDIKVMIEAQGYQCLYCKIELEMHGDNKYHIDHRMPLTLGGANDISNIQILCPKCNMRKGRTCPDVYEKRIGYVGVVAC